ncbi:glutamate synthase subunit beta [Clostridium sp. NSJ-145]|uniref:glutamate synthase subunit beta n=1 Tax=Clostridium sp. NSJ-145 TaxID=2897777 RepID=UPI001E461EC7|nr:glutamate synthase subunit beta [Clostridium sp. NSJ-145]MCD2501209.1 glutamate synthase subunit beta [Clostridium sp. NSJ-145]
MGRPDGFLVYEREAGENIAPLDRINNYDEFHKSLSEDKQKEQGARCMDCGIPYCQSGILINNRVSGCPLNNLIPEFNHLLYKGNYKLALQRLLMTNPFPEFTGRVCPAPCEHGCTVGLNGVSVSIKENERFIIDKAFSNGTMQAKPPICRTGKTIAIVGSGPAGLSAAYILNKLGHTVTVYEREDRVGGLLMYGIPNMKLDKSVVNRRVMLMKEEGVNFLTGVDVGKESKVTSMILNNYDSVILATGAPKPRDLNVKGRELRGIEFAVDYLKENTRTLLSPKIDNNNYIDAKNKNVLIIGGGDTGTDCVATALRQGAKSIMQLEITDKPPKSRSDNNPWPQWANIFKEDYGQEEYVAKFGKDPRKYLTSVKELIGDENGNVKKAVITNVKWEKTEDNRVVPILVENSEKLIDVDLVLIAMGFLGSEDYLAQVLEIELNNRGNIKADDKSYKTNKNNIFVCGDARRGQSLVVWAIREGIDVAYNVHKYLVK